MRKTLILITFAFLISCKGHDKFKTYTTHLVQVDSIVAANKNIDALDSLLSNYETNRDNVGKMAVMRELGKLHRESSDFKTALDYHEKALLLESCEIRPISFIYSISSALISGVLGFWMKRPSDIMKHFPIAENIVSNLHLKPRNTK